jgi:methylenetetrahydrofolate reductase (NADPH)
VLPGIMPITNLKQVTRFAELSRRPVPEWVVSRIAAHDDAASVRAVGIEIATELCDRLLAEGAPGLHYYTLNKSTATRQIHADVGNRIV